MDSNPKFNIDLLSAEFIKLSSFLIRETGYVFASALHQSIIPRISNELISEAAKKNKRILFFVFDTLSDVFLLEQLRKAILTPPGFDGLIISNLDQVVSPYNPNKDDIRFDDKRQLIELNFAREELNKLGVPMIFWVSEQSIARINQYAQDLFRQRQMMTIYVNTLPDEFGYQQSLSEWFKPAYHKQDDYDKLQLKIANLREQIQKAHDMEFPRRRIANEMVLPLAETYSGMELHTEALNYCKDYTDDFDLQNPAILTSLAEIYFAAHQTSEAIKFITDAIAIKQQENESDADLAYAYGKSGEMYAELGNLDKALPAFEQYNTIFKTLYDSNPQDSSYKNGLAISYSNLGETHSALGNLQQALTFYEERSRLGKELYEAFPNYVSFKNGLAISYSKIGETYSALGNLEKALTFYEERSQLGKELYEAFPKNVKYKNGLAISYEKLGNTHSALGNLEKALMFYEDETDLFKELYETFPANVNFKNGLAVSFSKIGDVLRSLGNLEQAVTFYKDSTKLMKELNESFPKNVSLKNGLAVTFSRLALVYYDYENGKQTAQDYFLKAEKLWVELVRDCPQYAEFSKNLSWVRKQLES